MNDRFNSVVLVVYAAVLGWYACKWWRYEREQIVWDTATEIERRRDAAERSVRDPDHPASTDSTAST